MNELDISDIPDYSEFFLDVAEAHTLPPEWTIPELLPTGLVILGGPPKAFKSTIVNGMACRLAGYGDGPTVHSKTKVFLNQLSYPLRKDQHGTVLYFSTEATAGEIKFSVQSEMGVVLPQDSAFLVAKEPWLWKLDVKGEHTKLLNWIRTLRPNLVVIDPLVHFHSVDENDAGAMTRILQPFQQWAKEHASTFLVVHHTKKIDEKLGRKVLLPSDLRGTSALFGMADGLIMVTPSNQNVNDPCPQVVLSCLFKRGAAPFERLITIDFPGRQQ